MRNRNNILISIIVLIIISLIISCQSVTESDAATLYITPSPNQVDIPGNVEEVSQADTVGIPQDSMLTEATIPEIHSQLSDGEIEKIIIDTIPGSFLPVTNDSGRIRIIYNDLDQNGYRDAFFLVVKNRENLDPGFSNLSDVSFLLKNERYPVDFFLSVFLQLQGGMISMFRIPVGSSVVISEFSKVSIIEGSDLPLGINISFQTVKGTNREWIIFSRYNKFSLFSLTENISSYSDTSDIDDDNIIDIVDWEDGLEEGTGYETYLTWYRWNGREYREYLSTNIVRNLNGFLEQSRLYLSFDQIDEFFRYSLNPVDSKTYRDSGDNYSDLLSRIFRTVPGTIPENDEFEDCSKIRSILFPPIFENPYSPGNSSQYICNINVRFECHDGYSFIRTARIQMNPNPFKKQQFSFYLE
ncbi:MAG: hypothetical protein PF693_03550 [Spirochaetia bacterium]|nr:hypothetical protein [Spirochaetia bacterium]